MSPPVSLGSSRPGAKVPAARPFAVKVAKALSVGRLMEYSEQHLARTVNSDHARDAHIASRLLENVTLYSSWEQSHGRLMRDVAAATRPAAQLVELRKVTFQTLHRKAPFEYLRERHLSTTQRRLLIQRLFGAQHYGRTVVREHAAYLSSACSYLCADALCGDVLGDASFCEALGSYGEAYAAYYRAYCDSLLADGPDDMIGAPLQSLLPYLRHQLKVIREHLLAGAPQKSDFKELQSLYAATGDTQKLPVLDYNLAP